MLRAVTDVSFSIGKRETVALVGESGSGKSTVAQDGGRAAATHRRQRHDRRRRYVVQSRDTEKRQALRRRIQMIFQDPYASLNPRWRVGAIIADPIRAFGLAKDRAEIDHQVGELLRLVGLDPADGAKYPHEFSGGQRQRICIARALSSNPEFLVADEPTSALDVSVQAQILNLMRDLQERLGLTYLFISHNLAVVRHMATRIGVMYLGRVVEIAPTAELFAAPRHPYARMLLDAVPDLAMTGRAAQNGRRRDPQSDRPAAGLRLQSPLPVGVRALPRGCAPADRQRRSGLGLPCRGGRTGVGVPRCKRKK